eukprot:TRINITY_DN6331_c0_g1_i2.p1 TRINITY_DN6331_c0_g1~~TRINITY_DN6331_c0_g1_i2.p1  ORF type:complete len:399 (-),score=30.46 TRINITY_DN6331_c0_g1_i2:310-1446(-)
MTMVVLPLMLCLHLAAAACTNPTCSSPPCAAALLGDVGCTTVSGTETLKHELVAAGGTISSNAHIYGPFEAGFTSKQDSIIKNWGCSTPSVVYDADGGKDINVAEKFVAHACNIQFPRTVGTEYIGVVGPCGGHTGDYHFHRSFSCLYSEAGGHSSKVGDVASYSMYGKWEDFAGNKLPFLDACGGHFGPTPESSGANVYHYHAQDRAPLTIGCHGPSASGGLVGISQCRALYTECGDGDQKTIETADGSVTYDLFCPCYDADGSNVGTKELPALSTSEISYDASGSTPSPSSSPTPVPSPSASSSPTPVPTPSSSSSPTPAPSPSAPSSPTPSPSPSPSTPSPTPMSGSKVDAAVRAYLGNIQITSVALMLLLRLLY